LGFTSALTASPLHQRVAGKASPAIDSVSQQFQIREFHPVSKDGTCLALGVIAAAVILQMVFLAALYFVLCRLTERRGSPIRARAAQRTPAFRRSRYAPGVSSPEVPKADCHITYPGNPGIAERAVPRSVRRRRSKPL